MVTAGDFRNGITFEKEGKVWQVIDFQHVKPGKGAAFVRTKYKNVMDGGIREEAFKPEDKFPKAHIDRVDMEYLYNDGEFYYFMDQTTYDQIALGADEVADTLKFVKENDVVKVCSYKGKVFAIEPPMFVELIITETEPGFKGNTATNTLKPAIVETGAEVRVSLFMEVGEKIKIDTRTGECLGRAN